MGFESIPWPTASTDLWAALVWVVLTLGVLVFVDTMLAYTFLRRSNKGHWFALHAIANAFVVIFAAPDVFYTLQDPNNAISMVGCDDRLFACNDVATSIIWAVHLYHILFYQNLPWDDWFHHLLFCGTIIPLHFMWTWGVWANMLSFFISGLPGGIDYFLLALVKAKWIDPLAEKRANTYLNMWLRSPGLVLTMVILYVGYIYGEHSIPLIPVICGGVLVFFNGQYYAERVVGSCHVSTYRRKTEKTTFERVADMFTSGNLREVENYEDVPIPVKAYEYVRGGS
eukprot:Hpha_TRINITY_DN12057_c1_g2::TRINITY_DN12057_c1_g2_i1::g.140934::m.140934